ncbi:hypothetical protein CSC94_23585 [Zhengella mangrovi]|uniref:HTH luxR-type domain-containing protein n=1 Tax=Zhengella mangrovi TaxID=1982044 RepID=A0A2G1QGI8_9HYPH|nr:helix-turn-helix transcriptional regulator [Zhengella mangrovi]PHP64581.1 hypothetical protein CSC94_23585 [Zhengella mangrovi]
MLLTDQERQCISFIAEGKSDLQIAQALGISEHTVDRYIAIALMKLEATHRSHAVAKAIRLALI